MESIDHPHVRRACGWNGLDLPYVEIARPPKSVKRTIRTWEGMARTDRKFYSIRDASSTLLSPERRWFMTDPASETIIIVG